MKAVYERMEYPRPHFVRNNWQSLNGEWDFCFDDEEKGTVKEYYCDFPAERKINVPFSYQSAASGVNLKEMHEVMWYKKEFVSTLCGKHILLNFNAVDYSAEVWLNGKYLGSHTGGYTAFSFDVSDYLQKNNILVVKVTDRYDTAQPRGKQFWLPKPNRCWYHATSGIWQSVWLEEIGQAYIEYALMTPDIDRSLVEMTFHVAHHADAIRITAFYKGRKVKEQQETITGKRTNVVFKLKEEDSIDELHYWDVANPNLYDVTLELLCDGKVEDFVQTYFGMRKISVQGDEILLNNAPLYQKLVLDQGYWDDSDLTPPSAESLEQDICYSMQMGFNGARKHQKIEDPYYYYYADRLGFLVWGEMPSAYCFCADEMKNIQSQYEEAVVQLFNHPSVIAFVPMNESWGVRKLLCDARQKSFVKSMYYFTKALDPSRLVCANDGWEQVEETDFIGIHDYAPDGNSFPEKYVKENLGDVFPMKRRLMGYGERYRNVPVIMTEYGGIALKSEGAVSFVNREESHDWGYVADDTTEDFIKRFENLASAVKKCSFSGFCYTQLTDVKQEINGLLNKRHEPKFDCAQIKKIIES
ncbi:MAG: glycoside hydrolase family 2 protein [Candidatus Gallimonas sp.]